MKKQRLLETEISQTIRRVGSITAKAALTTILGSVAVVFSPAVTFQQFFRTFVGVILVGFVFSFFFLPAILQLMVDITKLCQNCKEKHCYKEEEET